jgi:CheY-like chemotaxis protein
MAKSKKTKASKKFKVSKLAKQAKVMVVDDNFEDLSTMKSVLEKEGFEVVAVSNGAKAFDALKVDGFSLILIDIQMPTLSGYDLLRLMREKVNHHCPMVYVSIVPRQDVDLSDIDGFIQKPFSPQTFMKVVNKVLAKKKR